MRAARCDGLGEIVPALFRDFARPPAPDRGPEPVAEQFVRDRLLALGWRPPQEDGDRPAGSDPDGLADRLARVLASALAAAERDSAVLLARVQQRRAAPDVLRAARRCHALVADALLLGAVELAALLGVPDDELPA